MYTLEHKAPSASHYHKENERHFWRWKVRWDQFQFQCPVTNSGPHSMKLIQMLGKMSVTEKRKRATPKKKFRPATPKPTIVCPPLPEAPPKPRNSAPLPSVPVREDTPWPGTGKMLGNLFEDRNWLLPKTIWPLKEKMRMQLV